MKIGESVIVIGVDGFVLPKDIVSEISERNVRA